MTGRLSHSFQVRLHTAVVHSQHVCVMLTCIAAKELDRLTSGPSSRWSACTADIVPQQVAVSTLLEKYRQQHPELVHVQPQPQVHQQPNGMTTHALWMLSMFSAAHFLLLKLQATARKKSALHSSVSKHTSMHKPQMSQEHPSNILAHLRLVRAGEFHSHCYARQSFSLAIAD